MKKLGDLYWHQLSMWNCSKKGSVNVYCLNGFHYELLIVTKITSDKGWKIRNVMVDEISKDEIKNLTPETGHNWSRVMGNDLGLIN